jgi:hypothetical protein
LESNGSVTNYSFTGRLQLQRQRMHRPAQFLGQRGMDAALALDTRNAFERRRHHADMEMGLADSAVGARRAGMAGMTAAFVGDVQRLGREGGGQFLANGMGDAHAGRLLLPPRKVKKFISLYFTFAIP